MPHSEGVADDTLPPRSEGDEEDTTLPTSALGDSMGGAGAAPLERRVLEELYILLLVALSSGY